MGSQPLESMHLASASRKATASASALPALAAAMGSHAPSAARSAASHAAAAAAAVTPVTSRHVSSQSGRIQTLPKFLLDVRPSLPLLVANRDYPAARQS